MDDMEHAGMSRYSLHGSTAFKDDDGGYMLASQTIPYIEELRARITELEAERTELVKEAKKSALTELRKEFQDDYWPSEAKEGIAQAIESIDASLQAIDAAREGE